jgi:hypothetical protein
VATPFTSPSRPGTGRGLTDDLIALAGTPDDDSGVPELLRSVLQHAVDLLTPVTYASITRPDKDSYSTVAMTSEAALAVDEAQYAKQEGPCLDALRTAEPTAVPRIDTTMKWPDFRAEARRLGLRASLSIPLFAGRGTPIAALNLYSHTTEPMVPLNATVLSTFETSSQDGAASKLDGLDPGALQLVDGLIGAFTIRNTIQRAIGVLMATEQTTADHAYAILRGRAATTDCSLITTADSILNSAGPGQPSP